MKFNIRFAIGNRLGKASRYSLKEFCVFVVDRYSLSESEVEAVVTQKVGDTTHVDEDGKRIMEVKRVA